MLGTAKRHDPVSEGMTGVIAPTLERMKGKLRRQETLTSYAERVLVAFDRREATAGRSTAEKKDSARRCRPNLRQPHNGATSGADDGCAHVRRGRMTLNAFQLTRYAESQPVSDVSEASAPRESLECTDASANGQPEPEISLRPKPDRRRYPRLLFPADILW